MATTFSDLLFELAGHAISQSQPLLAHLCRMAALEAQGKSIPIPLFGWKLLGMWDWDAVHDFVHLDDECAELFGIDPVEVRKGISINECLKAIHRDDAQPMSDAVISTLKNGGTFEFQYRVISGDRERLVLAKGHCTLDSRGRAERFPGIIFELK